MEETLESQEEYPQEMEEEVEVEVEEAVEEEAFLRLHRHHKQPPTEGTNLLATRHSYSQEIEPNQKHS